MRDIKSRKREREKVRDIRGGWREEKEKEKEEQEQKKQEEDEEEEEEEEAHKKKRTQRQSSGCGDSPTRPRANWARRTELPRHVWPRVLCLPALALWPIVD